jgi:3-methyl-2-oxobutanoate hydroxymethyltransferase
MTDYRADWITQKKQGVPLATLTAADYPTARLLDEAGLDCILVGDSLGMVVLGYEDTTLVTLDDMAHHLRAVRRGVKKTPLAADLPYRTYETPAQALESARRLVDDGADLVKLEGGCSHRAQVEAILSAGIPLIGHIGMLPQSVREEGGYHKKGRTPDQIEQLRRDITMLDDAGVSAVVIEDVVAKVATELTALVAMPTIGIGSGSGCDGQILVTHDLIGAFPWFCPPFAKPEAAVAEEIRRAVAAYVSRVRR